MRKSRFTIFFFLLIVFFYPLSAQQQNNSQSVKPKLVMGIVIENMRPDYIQRYWSKFQDNGFKKLYSEGAVCSNFHIIQHLQNYASGTATLYTGVSPAIHGIPNKTWYSRLKDKEIDCTVDDNYFTVGADTEEGNASPIKLLSNTITDNLKIFSQGKAKIFSAALNRESAVFAAGHAADGAYWFDVKSGRMISSSFYVNTFPDWVRIFNSENYAEMYSYRNWVTLLPEATYDESVQDDYILEKGYFGKYNTFPHTISKYISQTKDLSPFKTTPSANLMIKDFTLEMLKGEAIGTDDVTDFVTTVFSSMDYIQGSFGPISIEMQDSYLYMDQYIGELITEVEKKFGKENVLFFLTANTSASYPVDYLREEFKLPVDHFSSEKVNALLTTFLNYTYGDEKWIEFISDLQMYLDHDLIEKKNLDLNKIRDVVSNFINEFEGVQVSMPAYQLEGVSSSNGMLEPLYNSYVKNRSGDILYSLKEGWQPSFKFKNVNFTDQTHIPLVFYGGKIPAKKISGKYSAIDFAPTISEFLHIPMPDKCQGEIIKELF